MIKKTKMLSSALLLLLTLGVVACDSDLKDAAQETGDTIEEGVNDTGRALEDAAD